MRDEFLLVDPVLIEQFTRATLKGLRFALQQRFGDILSLTRSLKIPEDLAGKGYDSARPALTTDGTMSEASQKKALDMVLKSVGVKEAPPLTDFSTLQSLGK